MRSNRSARFAAWPLELQVTQSETPDYEARGNRGGERCQYPNVATRVCGSDSSLSLKSHFGNKYLSLGIGAVVVLQLLFTYTPPLQALFVTEAIPLLVWPWLFLGGLVFFLVVEAEKLIIRMGHFGRGAPAPAEAPT